MSTPDYFAEAEFTQQALMEIFNQAYMKTAFTENGALVVQTEGPQVVFEIHEELKTLTFMAAYGLKLGTPVEKKLALVNKMNDEVSLAKFVIPELNPDYLIADYCLSFAGGIAPYLIISSVRLFAQAVSYAIRTFDHEELINRKN